MKNENVNVQAIPREEAITIIDNLHLIGCGRNQHEDDLKINIALDMAIKALTERTGKWILVCDSEGEGDNLYRCSECGCEYGCQEYDKPNFCLNCGAYMRNEVM